MPVLDTPMLHRPDEDMEHSVLVRFLGHLWLMEPDTQYAKAFELPGGLQHWWRLNAGVYGPSPVTAVDLLAMSMEERQGYLHALPLKERRELLQELEEFLQELDE